MADEYVFDAALAAADAAHAENRPFFFHIMTTSNHRPYTYPEARIPIPSGTGRNGAVMYTDYAIGRLLQAARAHDWFSRTLFVIVADHCAGSAGRESLPLERYHIPLWIYAPGLVAPGEYPGLASQVDIAPTLLGMLHMDYASSAFGKDLLQDDHPERALLGNYQNLGYLHNGLLTVLEPRKRIEVLDYGNAGAEPTEGVPDDALTTRTESYYQGAAWIYEHGLNGWARGQQLSHDRKPG
jgi:phosphoglycerol transferase MdoB-like AlkP superfamily enzyme